MDVDCLNEASLRINSKYLNIVRQIKLGGAAHSVDVTLCFCIQIISVPVLHKSGRSDSVINSLCIGCYNSVKVA